MQEKLNPGKVQNSPKAAKRVQLPSEKNEDLFGPGRQDMNQNGNAPMIGQGILPINNNQNDLFGPGPVGNNANDPFLAGPPRHQQPINMPPPA